ncbi:MAG: hypothetical protein K2N89_14185, partial [Lachnospiraceae bacterium]|nr:hypothetical protein [Lachnospiraceae bacterium]
MKDLKRETKRLIALLMAAALIIISLPQDTLTAVAAQIDEESENTEVMQLESDTVEMREAEDAEEQPEPSEENVKEDAQEQAEFPEENVKEDTGEQTKPSEDVSESAQENRISEEQTETENPASDISDNEETDLGIVDESA